MMVNAHYEFTGGFHPARQPCCMHRGSLGMAERASSGVPEGHQPDVQSHPRRLPVNSTGIVAAESGLIPVRALLNHRQARFTQRLYVLEDKKEPTAQLASVETGSDGSIRWHQGN